MRRVGTEAAVALWYNTVRVSTLTYGNVLDTSYAKSQIFSLSLSLSLSLISSPHHPPTQLRSWVGAEWLGSSPIQWKKRLGD
jgi:hypothetical protein